MHLGLFISFLNIIVFVYCGYPPTGDEVQAGSVLLPASRRGRYLANIVRRQAVDGTGIKFNKDADRMNAEAKKKVDVLSEELLPYIIAEQERRTTLYKRVMTAIQNGEKGVTVAEIRNKPPLIIRKGLLYRCPSNRAPKEPDGSGVIMCEENIEPTPIIYDSCLSAEDKELYVAERKYFFCNRRSADSPDLPRNSTSVYGCAPAERTSLNYTSEKCTLEDTDDIVVHFRYYPDRTFKFVSELDPEREVCDHWAPCQVGYIYSLPAPDQAITANELWHDYEEKPGDYSRDEIIPPVPEDTPEEYAEIGEPYELTKKYLIPDGFVFHGLGRIEDNRRTRITINDTIIAPQVNNIKVEISTSGKWMTVKINFDPVTERDFQSYYLRFLKENSTSEFTYKDKVLVLHRAVTQIKPLKLDQLPGQPMNKTRIQLNCTRCTLLNVMLRADDGSITNLDSSKYEMKIYSGKSGEQRFIELDLVSPRADQFGDYYALIQNEDNDEEKLKLLSLHYADLYVKRLETAVDMGEHFDGTVTYDCNYCELTDVICNGESAQKEGRVTILLSKKEVSFNFPNFQDEYACVYIGIFKQDDQTAKKEIAIIENADAKLQDAAERLAAPEEGEQLVKQIPFQCDDECSVEKLTVNGQKMEESKDEGNTRRHLVSEDLGPRAPRYEVKNKMLTIIFPFFSRGYAGNFMATFNTAKGAITKRVLEIDPPASKKDSPADQNQHTTEEEYPDNSTNGEQEGSSTNPEDQVSSSGASETPEVSSVEPGASSVEPGSSSVEPGSSSVEPGATSAEPVSTEAPTTTN